MIALAACLYLAATTPTPPPSTLLCRPEQHAAQVEGVVRGKHKNWRT